jgi:hypothetical protein
MMGGEGVVMGGRNLWYFPPSEKGKMGNYTLPSEKAKLKGKHGNDSKAWKRKAKGERQDDDTEVC